MADTLAGKGYVITASSVAALTAGAGETITLIGLTVANIHASTASWVTADVIRSTGTDSEIAHEINIPINDSLDLLQGKVILNATDTLNLKAENISSLEATLSYLLQT